MWFLLGWVLPGLAGAQSPPGVPFDLEFAGVTVHLPVASQQRVVQELAALYAQPAQLQRALDQQQQLSPLLDPLLLAQGIPPDFRYLYVPLPGASTYWSLPANVAPALKLRLDAGVDDRLHPTLATEAALTRLLALQTQSGNWVAALLQYLRDPVGQRPLTRSANPTYWLLDADSPALIWHVLARKLAFEQEEATYRPTQPYILYSYSEGAGQTLTALAQRLGTDPDRLRAANAWLRTGTVPTDRPRPVLVPVAPEQYAQTKSKLENTPANAPALADVGFPVVKRTGQTATRFGRSAVLYQINGKRGIQAQAFDSPVTLAYFGRVSVDDFLRYNDLTERDVTRPGELYYLSKKAKRGPVPYHVVRRSQTLRDVSQLYGVQLRRLLRYNGLTATQRVQPGRLIWLQRKKRGAAEYQTLPNERQPAAATSPVIARTAEAPTNVVAAPPVLSPPSGVATVVPVKAASANPLRSEPAPSPARADVGLVVASADTKTPAANPRYVPTGWVLHTVQPGQTYAILAYRYGVTTGQLYAWNNLSANRTLHVGQQLLVRPARSVARSRTHVVATRPAPASNVVAPTGNVVAPARPTANVVASASNGLSQSAAAPAEGVRYHVVQRGQTVYRVALINKLSVEEVMRLNGLKNYTIEVGQRLRVSR